jgi:hypothetical protein
MVVRCEIVGADKKRLDAESVIMYDIRIQDNARELSIERRFRDFLQLDQSLEQDGNLYRLPLPVRGLLGRRHRLGLRKFHEDRKIGIGLYLSHLCQQIATLSDSTPFSEFVARAPTLSVVSTSSKASTIKETKEDSRLSVLSSWETMDTVTGQRPPRRTYSLPSSSNVRLREFVSGGDRACFYSADWATFRVAQPALADVIQRCAVQVSNARRFENSCECLFRQVRSCVRSFSRPRVASSAGRVRPYADSIPDVSWADDIPGMVFLWEFLILVAVRRPFLINQAAEVCAMLESTVPGAKFLVEEDDLRILKESVFRARPDRRPVFTRCASCT